MKLVETVFRDLHLRHVAKRFSSSIAGTGVAAQQGPFGPNNSINPFMYNRNPRNLERLRIDYKPGGFCLDDKPVNFWNSLVIQRSNRHVTASIEHHSGRTVVTASTKEWAIKKQLKNTTDLAAMEAVGQVLAQRCLECGLLEIHSPYDVEQVPSKIRALLKRIEEGGIALSEPERFLPHRHWSREFKENPTQVYENPQ